MHLRCMRAGNIGVSAVSKCCLHHKGTDKKKQVQQQKDLKKIKITIKKLKKTTINVNRTASRIFSTLK